MRENRAVKRGKWPVHNLSEVVTEEERGEESRERRREVTYENSNPNPRFKRENSDNANRYAVLFFGKHLSSSRGVIIVKMEKVCVGNRDNFKGKC